MERPHRLDRHAGCSRRLTLAESTPALCQRFVLCEQCPHLLLFSELGPQLQHFHTGRRTISRDPIGAQHQISRATQSTPPFFDRGAEPQHGKRVGKISQDFINLRRSLGKSPLVHQRNRQPSSTRPIPWICRNRPFVQPSRNRHVAVSNRQVGLRVVTPRRVQVGA